MIDEPGQEPVDGPYWDEQLDTEYWVDPTTRRDVRQPPQPVAIARPRSAAHLKRGRGGVAAGMLAGALLAVRDVMEAPVDDEVAIVQASPGEPPGPDWLDVRLDWDDPGGSTVDIRPPTP